MEEVPPISQSESTLTAATNMLSFATNRRRPFDLSTKSPAKALMLAGAEIERVSFSFGSILGSLSEFREIIRFSSSLTLIARNITEEESLIVSKLASAVGSVKSLRKFIVRDATPSVYTLNTLAELLGPMSDLEISLRLSDSRKVLAAPLIDVLRKIHSLRKLDTSNNSIDDAVPLSDALRKDWRNLQSLKIMRWNPSFAGDEALRNSLASVACGLRTLELNDDFLCDSGIAVIVDGLLRGYSSAPGGRGTLRKLKLLHNCTQEDGGIKIAQLVKSNPHLTQINISYNSICSAGVAFGKSLRNCAATLQKLKLKGCYVSSKSVVAICHSLSGSYSLSVLNIDFKESEGVAEATRAITRDLLVAAKSLRKLDISYSSIDYPGARELVEGFARNNSLRVVKFNCNMGMGTAIKELLEAMLHLELRKLTLTDCSIDDAGYEAVGRFIAVSPRLRELSMQISEFSPHGDSAIFEAVAQSRSIEKLNLQSCKMWKDKHTKHVAEWVIGKSKTIQELGISRINIGVDGANAIAKAVKDVAGKSALRSIFLYVHNSNEVQNVLETAREAVEGYICMTLYNYSLT